jgi:hypothetical protein
VQQSLLAPEDLVRFVWIVYLGAQLLRHRLVEFCAVSDSLLILLAMGDLVWIAMVTVRVSEHWDP